MADTDAKAKAARLASLKLANLPTSRKNEALAAMAGALLKRKDDIIAANQKDLVHAEALQQKGELSLALVDRLRVDEAKIEKMVEGIRSVASLEDPIGRTFWAKELDDDLVLYRVSTPIGVVGVVFESRPDVVPQVAALALKSGNAILFKGGKEAANSNKVLYNILYEASLSVDGVPEGWCQLLETREEIDELLACDDDVDLMIPRGGNAFVKYVQEHTKIPVLGHSDGLCHVYVDGKADLEKAVDIAYDAKIQYPAVCNAMETLLVDERIAAEFLPKILARYREAGVEVRGDEKVRKSDSSVAKATDEDWRTEYNDLILAIRVVAGLDAAVDHINTYGSGHTDAIVSEDEKAAKKFLADVDSASVMWNASTRFSDGFRYGFGAEVGISTNKIHARGPVGLEGLTIYKYIVQGNGQTVAQYSGKDGKTFTHKDVDRVWKGLGD